MHWRHKHNLRSGVDQVPRFLRESDRPSNWLFYLLVCMGVMLGWGGMILVQLVTP